MKYDKTNQEAWLVILVEAKLNNLNEPFKDFEKHNKIINFGLGTFGSQILSSLKNDFGSEQLFNYLMIDYEGSNVDSHIPDNDGSLEHNSYSVANDYDSKTNIWSNFENNFSQFDQLEDKIRRIGLNNNCLLYTSPRPRDATLSRMPSSA